jgi:hypothetical protein
MHMWHHVTNHLIIPNDKDFNSENRIKLRVRDNLVCPGKPPVPSQRNPLTLSQNPTYSPNAFVISGLGSEHRTAVCAELATVQNMLMSSNVCH